jgi:alcohol dehydrogenase/L-iditol 2-dehydrogenase
VPFEVAALTEPCCVAYQATVVNARVKPGDVVVVIGPRADRLVVRDDGAALGRRPRGARWDRARPLTDGDRPARGRHARGGTRSHRTMKALLRSLGDGLGADVVIDSTGASASLQNALDWVRPAGHITKVGWGPEPMGFSMDALVKKAVTLQGSFSHTWPAWERVLQMLGSGQLDPRPYLSKVSGLDGWKDCFDGMHEARYIKAVLTP